MNRVLSTLLIIALILPIIAGLVEIPVTKAQLFAVKINEIYVTDVDGVVKTIEEVGGIWPVEPITLEVTVGLEVPFNIIIYDPYSGSVYVKQSVGKLAAGTYNITVYIPDKLPGLSGFVAFRVEPAFGEVYEYPGIYVVYPKVEVTPRVTPLIDEVGNFKTVSFKVYGVASYNRLVAIQIGQVCLINLTKLGISGVPDTYGIVDVENINLYNVCGHSLPANVYTIYITLADDTYRPKYKLTTLTITPMVAFLRRSGHGMWTNTPLGPDAAADPEINDAKNITIWGVGFPENRLIASVTLINWNYTWLGVAYTIDLFAQGLGISTGAFGEFKVTLDVGSNMTAGLYYPSITLYNPETGSYEGPYEFRYTYYLVRPILLFLYNGALYKEYPAILMPGSQVTLVAFGYGPSLGWTNQSAILHVFFDETEVAAVELGRDGNTTVTFTIPGETTYGSHYIKGIDEPWKYEYTIAVVIGTKAYFVVVNGLTHVDKGVNTAIPSYYGQIISVCPCRAVEGVTNCGVSVVAQYCDYLGDLVNITVYGLTPGEELVAVYLGDYEVPRDLWISYAPADQLGTLRLSFIVPTIPEGEYNVVIVTKTQSIVVPWKYNPNITTVVIVPKILLVSLDGNSTPTLVGSGIVRVLGVGFSPGAVFDKVIINGTDALTTVLTNVKEWSVNEKGVIIAGKVGDLELVPGLWIPFIEPGLYEVRLTYYSGTQLKITEPGYVYVVNKIAAMPTAGDVENAARRALGDLPTVVNNIYATVTSLGGKVDQVLNGISAVNTSLATGLAKLDTIASKLDSIATTLNTVNNNLNTAVSKISDAANQISTVASAVNDIKSAVSDVKTGISDIKSAVSNVASGVNDVKSGISDVKAGISDVKSAVNNVGSAVNSVSSNVASLSSKVDTAIASTTNAIYIGVAATVFALLAMIFALLAYTTIRKSVAPK